MATSASGSRKGKRTMDLKSITPSPATWHEGTRPEDNPATEWLRESYDAGEARQVTVPAHQARAIQNMLRQASAMVEIGVKVRIVIGGEEFSPSTTLWKQLDEYGDREVSVKYLGKKLTRRTRTVKPEKSSDTTEKASATAKATEKKSA